MQDVLLEVVALRARVAEMKEQSVKQEQLLQGRIREEYDNLIQSLVQSMVDLQQQFDEYREDLGDDVMEKICETRVEANEAMSRLALKTGATTGESALLSFILLH